MNINEKRDTGMDFTGTWHIYEMEAWDEDYFNMEVQAYIRINSCGSGWIRILEENSLEGEFRIHLGDDSTFLAIRAK